MNKSAADCFCITNSENRLQFLYTTDIWKVSLVFLSSLHEKKKMSRSCSSCRYECAEMTSLFAYKAARIRELG